jgi:hypothetical protein
MFEIYTTERENSILADNSQLLTYAANDYSMHTERDRPLEKSIIAIFKDRPEVKDNKELWLELVSISPEFLKFASEEMSLDKDIIDLSTKRKLEVSKNQEVKNEHEQLVNYNKQKSQSELKEFEDANTLGKCVILVQHLFKSVLENMRENIIVSSTEKTLSKIFAMRKSSETKSSYRP